MSHEIALGCFRTLSILHFSIHTRARFQRSDRENRGNEGDGKGMTGDRQTDRQTDRGNTGRRNLSRENTNGYINATWKDIRSREGRIIPVIEYDGLKRWIPTVLKFLIFPLYKLTYSLYIFLSLLLIYIYSLIADSFANHWFRVWISIEDVQTAGCRSNIDKEQSSEVWLEDWRGKMLYSFKNRILVPQFQKKTKRSNIKLLV